jgi:hypothetical protein
MAGDLFNNPSAYFSIDTGKGSEDVMEMVSSEWKVAGLLILKVSPYGIIAIVIAITFHPISINYKHRFIYF